jgi:hypothetical protein
MDSRSLIVENAVSVVPNAEPTAAPVQAPVPAPSVSCNDCDNNYECEICLVILDREDCPSSPNSLDNCDGIGVGELCEADGECGTSNTVRNCGRTLDVYKRIKCAE